MFNTEREREKFRSTAMEVMQKNHKWSAKIKVAIIFYINQIIRDANDKIIVIKLNKCGWRDVKKSKKERDVEVN